MVEAELDALKGQVVNKDELFKQLTAADVAYNKATEQLRAGSEKICADTGQALGDINARASAAQKQILGITAEIQNLKLEASYGSNAAAFRSSSSSTVEPTRQELERNNRTAALQPPVRAFAEPAADAAPTAVCPVALHAALEAFRSGHLAAPLAPALSRAIAFTWTN